MKVEQLNLFDMQYIQKSSPKCLSIGAFAKVLSSKGYNTGEKRLFDKLRKWRLLNKENIPYQEYMERGYFKVINEHYKKGGYIPSVHMKVLVTPSGQKYVEERLRNEANDNRA